MLLARSRVHIWKSESIKGDNTNSVLQNHDLMFSCLCVCLIFVNTFNISVLCIRYLRSALIKEVISLKIHYVIRVLPSSSFSMHNFKNHQKIPRKRESKQTFFVNKHNQLF